MNAEEYIIKRVQELEKKNESNEHFLLMANDKINRLEKGNIKLLELLDFLFENLKITYDNKTKLLQVGNDNLLVENEKLEEYFKFRDQESPWTCQSLRESNYRGWSHNTLEKDPVYDIAIDKKEALKNENQK